jgi:hypothetical protein
VAGGTHHLVWTAAFLAWLAAVPMYLVANFVDTVAHEGGHALVATLLFQRVRAIRVDRKGNGVTEFAAPLPWLANVLVTLAGHLGPSMFGLLAVALLVHGLTDAVLWASLAFLLLMLVVVRGWVGWLLVPALLVAIFWVETHMRAPERLLLTHMWVWFLLIVPVETMVVMIRREVYKGKTTDFGKMRSMTLLPGVFWAFAMLAGTVAALAYGGKLLLHHAG